MKTVKVEYESDTYLPEEIDTAFSTMQDRILKDHLEYDKIICHIGNLKGSLIRFLASHGTLNI